MARFYLLGILAVSVLFEVHSDDYIVHGTAARKNEFPWQGKIWIKIISDKCCLSLRQLVFIFARSVCHLAEHPPTLSIELDQLVYYFNSKHPAVYLHRTMVKKIKGQVKVGKSMCGGAIIDKKNILTAAHCTENESTEIRLRKIIVYVGLVNRKYLTSRHDVCGWTKHPKFNFVPRPSLMGPDIAILHLCEPLTFSKGKIWQFNSV